MAQSFEQLKFPASFLRLRLLVGPCSSNSYTDPSGQYIFYLSLSVYVQIYALFDVSESSKFISKNIVP